MRPADLRHPAVLIATWFGSGLLRPAPGTWGSLGGLVLLWPVLAMAGLPGLVVAFALLFGLGLWACRVVEAMEGGHDRPQIVIDEVLGMAITLMPASPDPLPVLAGFALFRLFDALKPWPICWIDQRVGGAFGVIADDLAAGVAAAIVLAGGIHVFS